MANEKRLIDANAVINALYEADAITMNGVAIINHFPTVDAVEVVRCKDCKYYTSEKMRCDHQCLDWEVECYDLWLETEPDDFCSYGERRANEKI